jgi:hypothetical protein
VKGDFNMSAKEELLNYLLSLPEAKIDNIIDQLPQLTSAIGETSPLFPQR